MCRILIEREGGNIMRILTDKKELEVVVVDLDYEHKDDPAFVFTTDLIEGSEKFSKSYLASSDEDYQRIGETLKKLAL